MALEKELATYRLLRDTLLRDWAGKYALIKGDHLENVYDTYAAAFGAGTRLFGNSGFLVKRIVDPEPIETGVPG